MLRFTFYVLSCRHPQICVLHATSLYFRNFITWRKNGVVSGNFVICSCQPSHLPRHISFRVDLSSISKLYFSIKAHPQEMNPDPKQNRNWYIHTGSKQVRFFKRICMSDIFLERFRFQGSPPICVSLQGGEVIYDHFMLHTYVAQLEIF